jgi:uncharacterized protein
MRRRRPAPPSRGAVSLLWAPEASVRRSAASGLRYAPAVPRLLVRAAIALCLLVVACAPAARTRSGAVEQTSEVTRHPVFMWRTESPTAVVHLLGSIHVGTEDMYPLDSRIEQAFDQSDALVLEIDLDEEAEADAALRFVQMALLPQGETLDQKLDEATLALLHARLEQLQIPYENVHMFRPWFVAMTIEMTEMESQGFSGEFGIDHHFREQAIGKKEILELESVEEQAALFASLSQNAEADDLRMALEAEESASETLTRMTEQWLAGNTELIAEEVERTRLEYPEAYEALYASRNRKMTRKVEGYLATDKDYFVVAGGAHMVGDEGIVELLREHGHTVVQQ